jgi:MFS family permease
MMNGDARRLTRIIVAASMGNALEWYDFTVFGYFALQISAAFFPATTQANALLLTWGTFGASFLARPLGAVVLGSYADRKGRRAAMTASILLMSVGTLLMAVIPGYASIGFAAPVCVLLARLMQGFSAGGEFGGATAFMIEHGQKRRGFFGSFQFTSQSLAQAAGAGTAWALSAFLSAHALHDWGFRIPFLIGLLIGPVGFYVRRHVDETPVFDAATADKAPALALLRAHPGRVLLGATTIAAGTAGTYLCPNATAYGARAEFRGAPDHSRRLLFRYAFGGAYVGPDRAHRTNDCRALCTNDMVIPRFHSGSKISDLCRAADRDGGEAGAAILVHGPAGDAAGRNIPDYHARGGDVGHLLARRAAVRQFYAAGRNLAGADHRGQIQSRLLSGGCRAFVARGISNDKAADSLAFIARDSAPRVAVAADERQTGDQRQGADDRDAGECGDALQRVSL